jgi:class 3 adenylate cyclase
VVVSTQTVTVLFTDMVGSTALSTSVDPETADVLRQDHFSVLRQALAAAGGTEVKSLGDGLMAVFSSTSAAIGCAVAMQEGVEQTNRRSPHSLGLRVGLSGGEVTVDDDDYFGDPVVEAARVCALCEGGQILVTDAVRFMVGRRSSHELTSTGEHELKGLPDPVALFEVGWTPIVGGSTGVPLPDRLDPDGSSAFGFIGRFREREQLMDALKHASAGARQIAFLSGEPGIGKTSICRQVAGEAHGRGVCVLYGRCDEDLGLPYQPFAEALTHLVVHADDELLADHVGVHGRALESLVPALAARVPELTSVRSADPDTERARLFAAVVGILASASPDGGLLIVVDDLHWADDATLQLLAHLARSAQLGHVMLLATYRDSELSAGSALSDVLATLRREADVIRLDLVGLDDVEVVAMMEAAAGHELADDGIELAQAVRRETEGNPFFTTEMLFHLSEAGLVRQGDDGRWVAVDDLYERGLPQSVREVVGQRIDRLGDETRRVLAQASVVGRDFDLDLLAMVSDIDEERVLDLLDHAVAAGLVAEVDGSIDRYTFAHALTQHTLYDDLGASRRARAHRRIAEAIEELCGAAVDGRAGELAHHYVAATKTADAFKALTYSRMAGDQALAKVAPVDARRWFAQALELYEQVPPDELVLCDLLVGLGTAQRQTGEVAHRDTLLRAAAIAQRLGDRDRLVRAALANSRGSMSSTGDVDTERVAVLEDALAALGDDDTADRALILATYCAELAYGDRFEQSIASGNESLAVARRLDDPVTFLRVATAVHSQYYPETVDDRLADLAVAVATAAEIKDPSAEVQARYWLAVAAVQAARRGEFDTQLDAMVALAEGLETFQRWEVQNLQCLQELIVGDLAAAEAQADLALALAGDSVPEALPVWGVQLLAIRGAQGRLDEVVDMFAQAAIDNPWIPALRAGLARVHCSLGRFDDARAVIEGDLADGFVHIPRDPVWLPTMANLAEVCAQLGEDDAGRLLLEWLRPWHAQMACPVVVLDGPVALQLGALARMLGGSSEAEGHLAESLEGSERLGSPFWIVRTRIEWAKVLLARAGTDDLTRAAAMLDEAIVTSRRHGFLALERQAEALR